MSTLFIINSNARNSVVSRPPRHLLSSKEEAHRRHNADDDETHVVNVVSRHLNNHRRLAGEEVVLHVSQDVLVGVHAEHHEHNERHDVDARKELRLKLHLGLHSLQLRGDVVDVGLERAVHLNEESRAVANGLIDRIEAGLVGLVGILHAVSKAACKNLEVGIRGHSRFGFDDKKVVLYMEWCSICCDYLPPGVACICRAYH